MVKASAESAEGPCATGREQHTAAARSGHGGRPGSAHSGRTSRRRIMSCANTKGGFRTFSARANSSLPDRGNGHSAKITQPNRGRHTEGGDKRPFAELRTDGSVAREETPANFDTYSYW